jgi:hypothetical protein
MKTSHENEQSLTSNKGKFKRGFMLMGDFTQKASNLDDLGLTTEDANLILRVVLNSLQNQKTVSGPPIEVTSMGMFPGIYSFEEGLDMLIEVELTQPRPFESIRTSIRRGFLKLYRLVGMGFSFEYKFMLVEPKKEPASLPLSPMGVSTPEGHA